MCTGLAARRAPTLRAPTSAAVWRLTCCNQTTAPAKPKMVRTQEQERLAVLDQITSHLHGVSLQFVLQACLLESDVLQVCN